MFERDGNPKCVDPEWSCLQKTMVNIITTDNPKNRPDDVSATVTRRKQNQKNEEACPICGLSNDLLGLCLEYVGDFQYGFLACTSDQFYQVYVEKFSSDNLTSIRSAAGSVSCAQFYLEEEVKPGCRSVEMKLFRAAADDGKVEVLKWGQDSGFELHNA